MDTRTLIVIALELAGTVAFAASGAMVGIRRGMDVFGVCVLGCITAVGGGMTRDIILGTVPGALIRPVYTTAAILTALAVFAVSYFRRSLLQKGSFGAVYERAMLAMDAVGLGIFTASGVATGISSGYLENTFLLTVLGTLTGVGGGVLRDMMAGVPPYILVKQFDAIEVLPAKDGQPALYANGSLSLGENIADQGGLRVAWTAYNNSLEGKDAPAPIDGFTDAQRFYLGYATLWAQNIRDEEIARLTKIDVHSLGKWRVNATLRNLQSFYDAFGITDGAMFLPEEKRVIIW